MENNINRAYRQFERFFVHKGPDYLMRRQESRPEELGESRGKGELIATIFYDNKTQTVETIRPDQSKEKK